jgi:CTP:molybdopterin cytidylyltransferase MocA
MPDPLPAAHAVWHAYETANCDPYLIDPRQAGLAAALRAAADQLDHSTSEHTLYAIADELEGNNG